MIEEQAQAATDINREGKVFYKGEYWTAQADQAIEKGAKVRIKKVSGLKLMVEEIKEQK